MTRKVFLRAVVMVALLFGAWQTLSWFTKSGPRGIIINEVLVSNGTGLTDEDGDHSDWIEIYNAGTVAVNLSGWSLTDDPDQSENWIFPDIALGSHEYLLVFASGKNRNSAEPGAELHTNFRLNKDGEFLGLYNIPDRKWMNVISPHYPQQFRDVAYGRHGGDREFGYLALPTPGGPNAETLVWNDVVDRVNFSVERGFYETPFWVGLEATTPGATIFYTTDGSRPSETNGTKYTEPIHVRGTTMLRAVAVRPSHKPSYIDTHTYVFLNDVLTQSLPPPGYPRYDYGMDPEIVGNPRYKETVKDDLKSIPAISIVTAIENYDIYGNPEGRGQAWERPASVELFYPYGDRDGFQINAGIRIHGGWGRHEFIPKRSLRVFFKGEYGATKLNYPLFPDSRVQAFDTIILRAGANKSYAGLTKGDYRLTTYTRDEWLRASQAAMSGLASHGIFVHLYLNGMYWGLYNAVERPDASFMASYLGGAKEDWYVMTPEGQVSGPDDRLEVLLNKLANIGSLDVSERYAAVKPNVDIAQLADYVILNFYAGNTDWSDSNWYAALHNGSDKVRFYVWDGESTWVSGAELHFIRQPVDGRLNLIEPAFKALIENTDFQVEFADRLYRHLYNEGSLTDANSQARWMRINDGIDGAIVGESARWGDVRFEAPITPDDWLRARDNVLAQMDGNADKLVELIREAGYYPSIDPPEFNQHGGLVESGFELAMTAPKGRIYFTVDGSDPRVQRSGAVASNALVYDKLLVLTTTTPVKARVLDGETWSALHEATFKVMAYDSPLRITEVMYNPMGGDAYEFIELKNVGGGDLDLVGMSFEGIRFTFPPNTVPLAPGGIVVLVRDPVAFSERYPGVSFGGIYERRLANGGEGINLRGPEGNVVVSVAYDDENGWPISPDGRGDSLVLVNPDGDPDDPRNWRASAHLNGSPGVDEPEAW
jgi:hypothetical protein